MEQYFKKIKIFIIVFGVELLGLIVVTLLSYLGIFNITQEGDFPLFFFHFISSLMLFLALFVAFLLKKRIIHANNLEDKLVAYFQFAVIPMAISIAPTIFTLIISFFHPDPSIFMGPLLSVFGFIYFLPSKTKLLDTLLVSEKDLEKVDWDYVNSKITKR